MLKGQHLYQREKEKEAESERERNYKPASLLGGSSGGWQLGPGGMALPEEEADPEEGLASFMNEHSDSLG